MAKPKRFHKQVSINFFPMSHFGFILAEGAESLTWQNRRKQRTRFERMEIWLRRWSIDTFYMLVSQHGSYTHVYNLKDIQT